jgi:hypothetical protein
VKLPVAGRAYAAEFVPFTCQLHMNGDKDNDRTTLLDGKDSSLTTLTVLCPVTTAASTNFAVSEENMTDRQHSVVPVSFVEIREASGIVWLLKSCVKQYTSYVVTGTKFRMVTFTRPKLDIVTADTVEARWMATDEVTAALAGRAAQYRVPVWFATLTATTICLCLAVIDSGATIMGYRTACAYVSPTTKYDAVVCCAQL